MHGAVHAGHLAKNTSQCSESSARIGNREDADTDAHLLQLWGTVLPICVLDVACAKKPNVQHPFRAVVSPPWVITQRQPSH